MLALKMQTNDTLLTLWSTLVTRTVPLGLVANSAARIRRALVLQSVIAPTLIAQGVAT